MDPADSKGCKLHAFTLHITEPLIALLLVVLDRDLLSCPVDGIKDTKVVATYLGGKQVYPLP